MILYSSGCWKTGIFMNGHSLLETLQSYKILNKNQLELFIRNIWLLRIGITCLNSQFILYSLNWNTTGKSILHLTNHVYFYFRKQKTVYQQTFVQFRQILRCLQKWRYICLLNIYHNNMILTTQKNWFILYNFLLFTKCTTSSELSIGFYFDNLTHNVKKNNNILVDLYMRCNVISLYPL